MPGVPANPTTAVSGQPAKASLQFNALAAQVAYLLAPPLAILRQTVAQSLPNGVSTALLFDTEDLDRDGAHSTSTNTSRYTAQTAGYYEITGQVGFTGNATGQRTCVVTIDGGAVNAAQVGFGTSPNAGSLLIPSASPTVYLNVGDYVEIQAFQSSGGALNTLSSGGSACRMNVRFVST